MWIFIYLTAYFYVTGEYKYRGNTAPPVVNAVLNLMLYFDVTYLIIESAVAIMHTTCAYIKKPCIVLRSEFNMLANSERKNCLLFP